MNKNIPKVLTIAGSDSGGGAGIQADLKTFNSLKVYGCSVITALTAQNTLGVNDIMEIPTRFIENQMDTVLSDIDVSGAKIGMLGSKDIISQVNKSLKKYNLTKVVLDPVMVSTSGAKLLKEDAIKGLIEELIPQSYLLTPNLDEAELLTGMKIKNKEDMELCCKNIISMGCKNVLLKGGHLSLDKDLLPCNKEVAEKVLDIFYDGKTFHYISNDYIKTSNTHGSGCTLSSAITAYLARGYNILDAVKKGITFCHYAIQESFEVGQGAGPLNHFHSNIEL